MIVYPSNNHTLNGTLCLHQEQPASHYSLKKVKSSEIVADSADMQ